MNNTKKIFLVVSIWLYIFMVYAAESTGVDKIDNAVTTGRNILQTIAKWGGVALLVSAGIMFGLGKLKGEAVGFAFYLLLGLGIIAAGFTWWDKQLGVGFVF